MGNPDSESRSSLSLWWGGWAKTLLPTGEAQAHLRVFAVEELVLLCQGCGPRPSPCSCGLQHSLPGNGDTFPSK